MPIRTFFSDKNDPEKAFIGSIPANPVIAPAY